MRIPPKYFSAFVLTLSLVGCGDAQGPVNPTSATVTGKADDRTAENSAVDLGSAPSANPSVDLGSAPSADPSVDLGDVPSVDLGDAPSADLSQVIALAPNVVTLQIDNQPFTVSHINSDGLPEISMTVNGPGYSADSGFGIGFGSAVGTGCTTGPLGAGVSLLGNYLKGWGSIAGPDCGLTLTSVPQGAAGNYYGRLTGSFHGTLSPNSGITFAHPRVDVTFDIQYGANSS